MCAQEHKLQEGQHCEDAEAALASALPGWRVHWSCSTARKGYSGTALLCRPGAAPLAVAAGIAADGEEDAHAGEGRVLTAEYPAFFVVNVYVPNSGDGLKRLDYRLQEWDPAFAGYLKGLEARGKPVIVTGAALVVMGMGSLYQFQEGVAAVVGKVGVRSPVCQMCARPFFKP